MKALYAHILLPTDGSQLATRGAKAGLQLAKALGSKVTVVFVGAPYTAAAYGGAEVYHAPLWSPGEHKRFTQAAAEKACQGVFFSATRFISSSAMLECA